MPSRPTSSGTRPRPRVTTAAMVGSTLLLVAVTVARLGPEPRPVAIVLVWLACITPPLVRIDVTERRLPNRLVLPALAIAVPLTAVDAAMRGVAPLQPLLMGFAVGAVLYVCAVFGGLGMGDVKLGALLGLAVGCFGMSAVLLFAMVSVSSAGLAGVVVVFLARSRGGSAGWRTRIPFGPFLLFGCWSAIAASA
ncbi:prepilin peptidase [Plantibacter flavus]|nr:A24 family peptidase [Plantibacter flavus]